MERPAFAGSFLRKQVKVLTQLQKQVLTSNPNGPNGSFGDCRSFPKPIGKGWKLQKWILPLDVSFVEQLYEFW